MFWKRDIAIQFRNFFVVLQEEVESDVDSDGVASVHCRKYRKGVLLPDPRVSIDGLPEVSVI
jgi:hypothetical protein